MQRRASSATHYQMFSPPKWERLKQRQEMQNTYLVSKTEQMLQDNCMFICVHLAQEKSWCPIKKAIATHTNSFSKQ